MNESTDIDNIEAKVAVTEEVVEVFHEVLLRFYCHPHRMDRIYLKNYIVQ